MDTKKRVLIVDDEPGILHFVRINLSLAGFDVITTTDGEKALKLIESQKPDIMLLDILMVPMDGFEVLIRVRAFSQLPVIVFTGRSDIASRALAEGANDFIGKPFRPDDLTEKIKAILEKPCSTHLTIGDQTNVG
jgi:DNA-binding response OmpR family regulator